MSTAYDHSFGVKATRLWNILPKDANSQTTLDAFKIALGGFLKQFPDRPPATGYTPPNSNSLLDWSAAGGHGVRSLWEGQQAGRLGGFTVRTPTTTPTRNTPPTKPTRTHHPEARPNPQTKTHHPQPPTTEPPDTPDPKNTPTRPQHQQATRTHPNPPKTQPHPTPPQQPPTTPTHPNPPHNRTPQQPPHPTQPIPKH
ncbi:unnamed protein product [Gadus morhua 'NCC']